jgi:HEAT repeat protein
LAALVDGCLDDADADVALAAALALARRGSRRASACLARALNARRRFTHLDDEHAAVDLCGQLGVSAARPGLRARAWRSWISGPSPVSFQARVSLARLGDARAREHILRVLSSRSRLVRTQSAAAAGQALLLDARELLCSMRGDESRADGQIVDEALGALGSGEGPGAN